MTPKRDWLSDTWLYSASDWLLADRIEINDYAMDKCDPLTYVLLQDLQIELRGEQARRIALKHLTPENWNYNQPTHMYKGKAHYSPCPIYYHFDQHLVDWRTKEALDLIINHIEKIDPALFGDLVERLPDAFIDPIIIKAEQANDCVYAVAGKVIGE